MREEMNEKKPEPARKAAEEPVRESPFSKFNDDDGIDVPVFLRKNQE